MVLVLPFLTLIPNIFVQPASWPPVLKTRTVAEKIGPGVTYARWSLATAQGPLALSITTVNLRDKFVTLTVAAHQDRVVAQGETLSSMADRVGAEVAINGDYFDINDTGSPLNALVMNGRIEHQTDGKAALMIDDANRILMTAPQWSAQFVAHSGYVLPIAAVNDFAPQENVTLVTRRAGIVDASGLTQVVLHPDTVPSTYRVASIASNVPALLALGPDDLGIAARGDTAAQLAKKLSPGDAVQLLQQWQLVNPAMNLGEPSPSAVVAAAIVSAIGGGPLLLRGGQPFADPNPPASQETFERYPLTGAGVSADGSTLWLVTVDGRSPQRSVGITRPMLASLFAALGASDAMAFDTGGSAEMVVRHLGDARASVANVPSDGAERPIADGLFVVNSAPRGPAGTLILRVPFQAVLAGSSVQCSVAAVDNHLQPANFRVPAAFSVAPASVAMIDSSGLLKARQPGTVTITASSAHLRESAAIRIVAMVARLAIATERRYVPTYGVEPLHIAAQTRDGVPVAVDDSVVRWSVADKGAAVDSTGMLHAGGRPARVEVVARVPGAFAVLKVAIGDHAAPIDAQTERWRYASLPAGLPGAVDGAPAPDGSPAIRLAYDFSTTSGFRAAYAQTNLTLPGEPVALRLDAYGDGRHEWLRAAYRNADGIVDTITLARHVDWTGWRKIRAALSAQARFPIALTRLYAIEASSGHEEGTLWFRSLEAIDPGP